jgi:hypothetical protein
MRFTLVSLVDQHQHGSSGSAFVGGGPIYFLTMGRDGITISRWAAGCRGIASASMG